MPTFVTSTKKGMEDYMKYLAAQNAAFDQSQSAADSLKIIDEMGKGEKKRIGDDWSNQLQSILGRFQGRGLGTSALTASAAQTVGDRAQQGLLSLSDMLLSKKLEVNEAAKDRALQKYISNSSRTIGSSSRYNGPSGGSSGGLQSPSAYAAMTPNTPEWYALQNMYRQHQFAGNGVAITQPRPNLTAMLNQLRGV